MKVIVCGAGQVGWQIARQLSGEGNDVTIIDVNADLVRRAAALGVRLVGTDCPSVDALSSQALPAHAAFMETGLHILEGLNLGGVTPGRYQLVCLPLPLVGTDGAPARAVLLDLPAAELS